MTNDEINKALLGTAGAEQSKQEERREQLKKQKKLIEATMEGNDKKTRNEIK